MNIHALFCDGTGNYVFPPEPLPGQQVTLQFRTGAGDADSVCLLTGGREYEMEKRSTSGVFDYYAVSLELGEENLYYSFRVRAGEEVWYYNQFGATREKIEEYEFQIAPGFSTPDWAKGAVMYQIFVDRFCNGDPSNDVEDGEYIYIGEPVEHVKDWNEYPAAMDVRRFYGGDLKGVMEKLDYLQDLGVEVIYFNPLFVSPSNHKYDIQDYDYIDPHFGVIVEDGGEPLPVGVKENVYATKYQKRVTDRKNLEASNQLFIKLVEELHRRGMKVILDGVFNHCGSFNKWMDRERIYEGQEGYEKGAYVSADSPYRDFFEFFQSGDEHWPYNGNYDGWWGHDTLPKLNYEGSKELEDYIVMLGCIRVDHSYQQGLSRMWTRKTRFDFYHPMLANLGEMAVLNKEIYCQGNEKDDEVFGYQEAWADYRYHPNIVTGEMRSQYAQSLDAWHYADYYEALPTLSSSWIQEGQENIDRTLAVQSENSHQFICDFFFDQTWTRPMPIYSVPGLSNI
jgi:alpha-glucosidase